MFTHNIFRCLRVRALIVHDGRLLVLPRPDVVGGNPPQPGAAPGGGIQPKEGIFDAAEREVLEETGLRVKATSVAFLREWVVPKHWPLEDTRRMLEEFGVPVEVTHAADYAYGLEVYVWAHLIGDEAGPTRADPIEGACRWVPFQDVDREPVFPKELRALARDLAAGRKPAAVPCFTSGLGDPWEQPDFGAFRTVQGPRL